MTLHVALDGIDDCRNEHLVEKLKEFFTKKSYNVKTITKENLTLTLSTLRDYNLTLSESALLTALDRSIVWNNTDFSSFDLVIWNESILSSYVHYTDETVKSSFIQAINRFFPSMDLYIVLQNYTKSDLNGLVRKYDKLIAKSDNIVGVEISDESCDKALNSVVNVIFSELPTCKWCGRLFTKNSSNKKYCSKKCKAYAKEEQNRDNFRNYYNRYKDIMSESQKGALGSMGANLHGKAKEDLELESRLIKNEKKRLGL